ncbi:MAG: Fic family protein [Clostridia bacterium]|nr:Fic family protein [Clostridia bacterium]
MKAFDAKSLPLKDSDLNQSVYMEALIDATTRLEVYKTKLDGSKLDRSWFLPTLQKKEALASSQIEGTQATLDGVLIDQVNPSEKDKDMSEVRNYVNAALEGYHYLKTNPMSVDFIKHLHKILMSGNVRRNKATVPGEFRHGQNYLGSNKMVSYIPPIAENVDKLMENFVEYFNSTDEQLRPLVRAAIMHAQFETIHPFMDGNGRVGRILIPLFLYKHKQISLPCFFISETLERDKFKYYALLNGIREENDWNSWVDFFLSAVDQQCGKYIELVDRINTLYEADLEKAKQVIKSNKVVDVINLLYKYPAINTSTVSNEAGIPSVTATRYLNALEECKILYSDKRPKNRTYYYYGVLEIIR